MTWSRARLEQVAGARLAARASLAPVEEAALAFARWQGLTDENAVEAAAAKLELDRALVVLDDLGPDGWIGLAKLADDLGDEPIIGLMKYSLGRSTEQVLDAERVAPQIDDGEPEESVASTPSRRRRRDRDK